MRSDFLIAADHLPKQAPDKPKKQKETSNALAFFAENATGVPFILTADPAHDTDIVSVDSLDPGSWTVPVAVRKTFSFEQLMYKMIILPRQTRDKHKENSKKRCVFRRHITTR